jgi:hypothetical protein
MRVEFDSRSRSSRKAKRTVATVADPEIVGKESSRNIENESASRHRANEPKLTAFRCGSRSPRCLDRQLETARFESIASKLPPRSTL